MEQKKNEKSYEFLKETIKEKPIDKKKINETYSQDFGIRGTFWTGSIGSFIIGSTGNYKKHRGKTRTVTNTVPSDTENSEENTKNNIPEEQSSEAGSQPAAEEELTPEKYQKLFADVLPLPKKLKNLW